MRKKFYISHLKKFILKRFPDFINIRPKKVGIEEGVVLIDKNMEKYFIKITSKEDRLFGYESKIKTLKYFRILGDKLSVIPEIYKDELFVISVSKEAENPDEKDLLYLTFIATMLDLTDIRSDNIVNFKLIDFLNPDDRLCMAEIRDGFEDFDKKVRSVSVLINEKLRLFSDIPYELRSFISSIITLQSIKNDGNPIKGPSAINDLEFLENIISNVKPPREIILKAFDFFIKKRIEKNISYEERQILTKAILNCIEFHNFLRKRSNFEILDEENIERLNREISLLGIKIGLIKDKEDLKRIEPRRIPIYHSRKKDRVSNISKYLIKLPKISKSEIRELL